MSDALKIGDRIKTKPGIQTIGGWSGESIIRKIIHDDKQPDNPIVIIRRKHTRNEYMFGANELDKI